MSINKGGACRETSLFLLYNECMLIREKQKIQMNKKKNKKK